MYMTTVCQRTEDRGSGRGSHVLSLSIQYAMDLLKGDTAFYPDLLATSMKYANQKAMRKQSNSIHMQYVYFVFDLYIIMYSISLEW